MSDVSGLAKALSHPGIDPREWLVFAIVTELGFDPDHGKFIDYVKLPKGGKETAYIGEPYAGDGFGMHFPVDVGDMVLIAIPGGETGFGPTIIARMHQPSAKPHADMGSGDEPIQDVYLRVRKDQKLIIRTSGTGDAVDITVEGDGDVSVEAASGNVIVKAGTLVELGASGLAASVNGVVTGESINPFTGTPYSALGQASSKVVAKK